MYTYLCIYAYMHCLFYFATCLLYVLIYFRKALIKVIGRVQEACGAQNDEEFEAEDSRLAIIREAVGEDGEFHPIEYLPNSWCGNSYHTIFLPAGQAWSFVAPQYQGTLTTQMRFRLEHKGETLYSNTFEGQVNLSQFKGKQGHQPTNIMDPYNE